MLQSMLWCQGEASVVQNWDPNNKRILAFNHYIVVCDVAPSPRSRCVVCIVIGLDCWRLQDLGHDREGAVGPPSVGVRCAGYIGRIRRIVQMSWRARLVEEELGSLAPRQRDSALQRREWRGPLAAAFAGRRAAWTVSPARAVPAPTAAAICLVVLQPAARPRARSASRAFVRGVRASRTVHAAQSVQQPLAVRSAHNLWVGVLRRQRHVAELERPERRGRHSMYDE